MFYIRVAVIAYNKNKLFILRKTGVANRGIGKRFFRKCTRSDDRVGTLYANRHLNPINRTRSRPSSETLYAGGGELSGVISRTI